MKKTKIYLGTDIKYNIHIDPIDSLTMSEYDFEAEFMCVKNTLRISKSQMKKVDDNNYIARVESTKLGVGEVKLKVTAYIPDTFILGDEVEPLGDDDSSRAASPTIALTRKEVVMLNTETIIVNTV